MIQEHFSQKDISWCLPNHSQSGSQKIRAKFLFMMLVKLVVMAMVMMMVMTMVRCVFSNSKETNQAFLYVFVVGP